MFEEAPSRVHGSEVTYELHSLGWKAFQQLCVTVTSEVFGQHVQSFADSRDGGRDGAFHGTWSPKASEPFSGSFTVQCKFTAQAGKTLSVSDLCDELTKAERLAERGLADSYLLFTNARITGAATEQIAAAFEAIPGIAHFAVYGAERISMYIRERPRLRMLVPRVYGLGDLSQILDERAYAQAIEVLSALGDDLEKFVITDSYRKSAQALVEHSFVLLLGEPACGKSTIAAALSMGALDEWGCSTLKVRDADDFVQHWNPREPKQFFWVDDVFGATQLDGQGAGEWSRAFPHIQAAIRRGAKVVFTSRDYIYREAERFLKQSALPVLQESQVIIQVDKMSKNEKEQILYNHIRLGTQSVAFKRSVKAFLPAVSDYSGLSPEISRRLGNPAFTKLLCISKDGLLQFVSRPMEFLKEIIKTLDANARSAIALVFMRGGTLPCPMALSRREEEAVDLLGGTVAGVRNAFEALKGSLLILVQQGGGYFWRLKHPAIRDAFAALIAENRELMDIYLMGTPIRQLFQEVSCGDVGLAGLKVVVPTERYEAIWQRIEAFLGETRESKDPVNLFLANRCDRGFLCGFIARNVGFISSLQVGVYLSVVSDVSLIVKLRQLKLLPEVERLRHVVVIRKHAVTIPNADFLKESIRPLFTTTEFDDILGDVRTHLLPCLSERIADWQNNYNEGEDPERHFLLLKCALEDYQGAFSAHTESRALLDAGLTEIEELVEALRSELPDESESEDYIGELPHGSSADDSRSIFDDVDL